MDMRVLAMLALALLALALALISLALALLLAHYYWLLSTNPQERI